MIWTARTVGFRGLLGAAVLAACLPGAAFGQASCNGLITVSYTSGINYALPGDVVRVRLQIGTGPIMPVGNLVINALRFNLDCTNVTLGAGLLCADEGAFVQYEGDATITDTCPGLSFTTGHAISDLPNQVVFTPTIPLVIPQNQAVPPGFCQLEFDVRVLASPSIDGTPLAIEEVGGYLPIADAFCTNAVPVTGGVQSAAIPLCPVCNDNQECTTDACDQNTGMCVFTPVGDSTPCLDNDGNACTFAGCEAGLCVQGHNQTICPPDANDCTQDPPCNPLNGLCEKPPVPDSQPCADADGNACTFAGCEMGICAQAHNQTICTPDTNQCTQDPPCNPANGLCEHPPVPDSTPCADSDGNACTTAGCEAGSCAQAHNQVVCNPDTNVCTLDPPCNPANGLCEHPPVPDGGACPDTDGSLCTIAACVGGSCSQTFLDDACLNHFHCYEIKPFQFSKIPNVSLVDQFGSSVVTVDRPNKLCAPADKNDEDPDAVTDPDHLTSYKVRNRFTKRLNQVVQNQFGTLTLDVVKPDALLVPTAKSLAAPVPLVPANPAVDHFQCYKVKRSKGTPKFQKVLNVQVDDQFGTGTFDLIKPVKLCAPANKQGEEPGAETHAEHLLCYKVKARAPFNSLNVWLNNQLGPLPDKILTRRQEFCVPSIKNPGASTTTTTAAPTTTTTTTSTTLATTTTTTTTTSTTTTTIYMSPSGAFIDAPRDLLD